MSYIGNIPTTVAFLVDTFSGDGSDTTFTLTQAPANTSSILVSVSGVVQDPSTYSVSGTTLTFSGAPPSGSSNISVRFLGIPASGVSTTAYRTVTEFTATAGQTSFTVPSYTVGYIDVYRNGVMLGTADFTASSGTTVVLASGATAGDLIRTESFYVSSVLNAIPAVANAVTDSYINTGAVTQTKVATGVAGTGPAFIAYGSGAFQTISTATWTKMAYNNALYDTNSNYSTTNYRFTPTVAGYYEINASLTSASSATGAIGIAIYKNGLVYQYGSFIPNSSVGPTSVIAGLVYCNGSTDYVEIYGYQNSGGNLTVGVADASFKFAGALVRAA
jgi:hypothetical protein